MHPLAMFAVVRANVYNRTQLHKRFSDPVVPTEIAKEGVIHGRWALGYGGKRPCLPYLQRRGRRRELVRHRLASLLLYAKEVSVFFVTSQPNIRFSDPVVPTEIAKEGVIHER